MSKNKIAVGYCRFSSDHQKELSIDAQKRKIIEYCERNGYEIIEWYIDRAFSGQTVDRPDFQRLLRTIKSGNYDFDTVIVHKFDRFSRNVVDTLSYYQFLNDKNIKLLSVEEDYGDDDFMFIINAGLNQRYVQNLSKEVMKGMNERAYKALFNGGKPPLGYDVSEDGQYIINEAEAVIVRMIFEMSAKGYGYNTIIRELNSRGYKTKKGNQFGNNSIYDLLRNEKYCGTYCFNKTIKRNSKRKRNMHKYKDDSEVIRVEGAIPAIVSVDLWNRANASRKITAKTSTNAKYNYLLSGLIYCGECGAKFHGKHRKYGANAYNVYQCNKKDNQLLCGCKEIRADIIEDFVINCLKEHFFNENIIDVITEQVNKKVAEIKNSDNEIVTNAKNALSGLKLARSNIVETLAKTGFNATLTDKLNSIEQQIEEYEAIIEADRAKREDVIISREDIKRKIDELTEIIKNPDNIDQTKLMLRNYIERIEVSSKTISVTFKVAVSFLSDCELEQVFYNHTVKEYRLLLEQKSKTECRRTA